MAKERTLKEGLQFFPLDIDYFDDSKILMIEAKFGLSGSVVATRMLCSIYRQGYYMTWNDGEALALARKVGNGITFEAINDIVKGLLNCDFFDRKMFEAYGILTSNGIQTRWQKIITDCNRKSRIKSDFNLLIDEQKSDLSHQKSEESPQIKEKKRKEEESKEKHNDGLLISFTEEKNQKTVPREANELVEKLCKYFSVTTDVMSQMYSTVSSFVEIIFRRGELPTLINTFEKYQAYKARSQEQIHGIEKWIGTRDKFFQDGKWKETNWELKLKNYEQQTFKGTNRTTSAQVGGTQYHAGGGF